MTPWEAHQSPCCETLHTERREINSKAPKVPTKTMEFLWQKQGAERRKEKSLSKKEIRLPISSTIYIYIDVFRRQSYPVLPPVVKERVPQGQSWFFPLWRPSEKNSVIINNWEAHKLAEERLIWKSVVVTSSMHPWAILRAHTRWFQVSRRRRVPQARTGTLSSQWMLIHCVPFMGTITKRVVSSLERCKEFSCCSVLAHRSQVSGVALRPKLWESSLVAQW